MKNIYLAALELEEKKMFSSAYEMFQQCLKQGTADIGDVLFHCGWCFEMQYGSESEEALIYYSEGIEVSDENICKMNCCFRSGWILMHLKNYPKAVENFIQSRTIGLQNQMINSIYYDASYWLAICLEAQAYYLDALKLHREIQTSENINSIESKWREICCLNQIGRYDLALQACNDFYSMNSNKINKIRFIELSSLVDREKKILFQIIND